MDSPSDFKLYEMLELHKVWNGALVAAPQNKAQGDDSFSILAEWDWR
jgi:hypothetical protein